MGFMVDPKGRSIAKCPGALEAVSLGASVFPGVEQKQLLSEVAVSVFKTQCDTHDYSPTPPTTNYKDKWLQSQGKHLCS